jgi:uncharacterized protein (DUF1697 family)
MRSLVLLRGINVGGKHKVAMKDLTAWLEAEDFGEVTTYIQSGNVVLDHDDVRDIAREVHDVLTERTGWDIPVIVRRANEMRAVLNANPYPGVEPRQLHVAFLASAPEVGDSDDAERWRPEEYRVAGREVYLFVPDGLGRSVMAPRLTFLRPATMRNWNTVVALTNLLDD